MCRTSFYGQGGDPLASPGARTRVALGALLLVASMFSSGCASRTRLIKNDNAVVVEGLFQMWGSWVKNKGEKVDLRMHFANDFDRPIMIRARDMHCSRGDSWGDLLVLDGGSRNTIRLSPEQVRRLILVCRWHHDDAEGDLKILVSHIFEAHPNGGPSPASVLATDIEWLVPDEAIR